MGVLHVWPEAGSGCRCWGGSVSVKGMTLSFVSPAHSHWHDAQRGAGAAPEQRQSTATHQTPGEQQHSLAGHGATGMGKLGLQLQGHGAQQGWWQGLEHHFPSVLSVGRVPSLSSGSVACWDPRAMFLWPGRRERKHCGGCGMTGVCQAWTSADEGQGPAWSEGKGLVQAEQPLLRTVSLWGDSLLCL